MPPSKGARNRVMPIVYAMVCQTYIFKTGKDNPNKSEDDLADWCFALEDWKLLVARFPETKPFAEKKFCRRIARISTMGSKTTPISLLLSLYHLPPLPVTADRQLPSPAAANRRSSPSTFSLTLRGSFENSYIPENPRTPKPLTFSKNRLRGAKNRSNISPVAKNFFRKNDFFVLFQNRSKTRNFFKFFYRSLYNTYLKSCKYAQKIKKSCTYAKVKKKYRFFGNVFQRIVMIKNVLEGSEVGFLKGITILKIKLIDLLTRTAPRPVILGIIIIDVNPGNIRVCSGPDFLPAHSTSEDKLDISGNYRELSKFGNWFQLNCSFLRFTTIFTVTVYGFCAAVLKQS
ncbi:hypothetical protein LXL04_034423 [Taraxacum kok-saghyz]